MMDTSQRSARISLACLTLTTAITLSGIAWAQQSSSIPQPPGTIPTAPAQLPSSATQPTSQGQSGAPQAPGPQIPGPQIPGPQIIDGGQSNQARLFIHPTRGYQLPIPAGVKVEHRGPEMHVGIKSREGYLVNLQTGDVNPRVPLEAMLGRLEARYMGDAGPWQRKLSQERRELGGLPALEAVYLGGKNRSHVLIARGQVTDFVFTFTAPQTNYLSVRPNLDWILDNFKPGAAEGAATHSVSHAPVPTPQDQIRTAETPAVLAQGRPNPAAANAPKAETRRFVRSGFGFTIDYPATWVVNNPSSHTALFSGPEGSEAFDAVVSVQNVKPPQAKNPVEAADRALADLKAAIKQEAADLSILGEGDLTDGSGKQMMARYTYSGQTYRKWTVVVPRRDVEIAHVWSFTAPEETFVAYQVVARQMLESWTLTP